LKVAVIGASGFVGGRIGDYLKKKNIKVYKYSRKKIFNNIIKWNSKKNLEQLCRNKDVIINCSGFDTHKSSSKSKKKTLKVNISNPLNLFHSAKKLGVKTFVHISTSNVYKNHYGFINEKSKIFAKNFYIKTKLDAENKLFASNKEKINLIILRPCNLFGYPVYKNINCWKLFINSIIKNITLGKKIKIKSKINIYKNYSSMKSFCEFIHLLITKTYKNKKISEKIINYCSHKNMNITDIVNLFKEKDIKKLLIQSKLKKSKKYYYKSIYQKKYKPIFDKYFYSEIEKTIQYCKKNFI
jgi:nucleoside-diphosphate-sugar epimerase